MTASRPTPSTFREPVLRALGTLSNLVSGAPVPMKDVLSLVYAETGFTEDQFGENNYGQVRTRLWVQQCNNKLLRKQKLTGKAGRGKWCLTDEGVKAAAVLLGKPVPAPTTDTVQGTQSTVLAADAAASATDSDDIDLDDLLDALDNDGDAPATLAATAALVEPVAASQTPVEPSDPTPAPAPVSKGGEGVSWTLGAQVNTYNDDPYIRGLAIESTECFGSFSARSKVCGSCPLSGACKAAVISDLASIAAQLRKADVEAAKKAAAPSAPALAAVEDDDSIDSIIDAINAEVESTPAPATDPTPKGNALRMKTPADGKCRHCGNRIPRGTEIDFVRGSGIFHTDCYPKWQGGNP